MKVTRAVFRASVRLPSGRMVSAISSDDSPGVDLQYDREGCCLKLGVKRIPLSSVVEFDIEEASVRCTECGQEFASPGGLGGHMAHVHKKRRVSNAD